MISTPLARSGNLVSRHPLSMPAFTTLETGLSKRFHATVPVFMSTMMVGHSLAKEPI